MRGHGERQESAGEAPRQPQGIREKHAKLGAESAPGDQILELREVLPFENCGCLPLEVNACLPLEPCGCLPLEVSACLPL